jgi:integrase
MTRQRLATYGERGNLVRLIRVTGARKCYLVQWGTKGARGQRAFPLTAQGKQQAEAFAKAFSAEQVAAALTTRELWEKYTADQFPTLRPNSRRIYREAWRHWELFYGTATDPGEMTLEQCGAFRRALEAKGLNINTARSTIRVVRTVYNWAEPRDLITRNRWHGYRFKVTKGTEPAQRAEYRADEFLAIWRELDPTDRWQWRAWAIIGLLGIYGNRQHAVLSMEWDWDCGDEIVIPAAVEKTGKTAYMPVFPLTRSILEVCRGWREREGYAGPFVFFAGAQRSRQGHYSIQSLTDALHRAETRAGIAPIKWRAGHGFRRGLVGDLADHTGDVGQALQAIGDSLAMAKHYRVRRDDRIRSILGERIARMIPESATQGATESATDPDSDPTPPLPTEG